MQLKDDLKYFLQVYISHFIPYLLCSYEKDTHFAIFVSYTTRENSVSPLLSFSSLVQMSSQPQVKGCRVDVNWGCGRLLNWRNAKLCNSFSREWQELLLCVASLVNTFGLQRRATMLGKCPFLLKTSSYVYNNNIIILFLLYYLLLLWWCMYQSVLLCHI